MLKKIAFAGTGIALLASPLLTSADTLSDLQAQVQALLSQIASLQQQLGTLQNAPNTSTADSAPQTVPDATPQSSYTCVILRNNIGADDTDETTGGDVTRLQKFLTNQYANFFDKYVTGYFGPMTEAAVKQWQSEHGLVSTGNANSTGWGYIGPKTRAALAQGCGTAPVAPTSYAQQTQVQPSTQTTTTAVPEPRIACPVVLRSACPAGQRYLYGPISYDANNCPVQSATCVPDTSTALPASSFSASPTSGQAPLTVTFTVRNAGTSHQISFGDGTKSETMISSCYFGNGQECPGGILKAAHTYTAPGTYIAVIKRVPPCQNNPLADCQVFATETVGTVTITVGDGSTGGATFSAWPTSGAAPLSVWFSSSLKGGGKDDATYTINYGDGAAGQMKWDNGKGLPDSWVLSSNHSYTANGTYTATLIKQPSYSCPAGFSCPMLYPAPVTVGSVTIAVGSSSTGGITVTSPNGGERWEMGIMNTVTWTPYQYNPDINPSRDVGAHLERKNPDGTFTVVGRVQEEGKASIHWQTGHLNSLGGSDSWAQPGQYYIRVVNNMTGATDRSDAAFTILPRSVDVKVNGSDGPLTINPTQKVWVEWTSSNKTSCTLYGVMESPTATQTYIGNLPTSGKREVYAWFYDPSYGTTITAQCTDASGNAASDWVQVNATAQAASIRVVSPNGGEQITLNKEYSIETTSQGISMASVALYKNDQWMKWIHKDQPTTPGGHSWGWLPSSEEAAAASQGAVFKIYVTGTRTDGQGYVDDKSDAPFSFTGGLTVAPTVSVVSPNYGGSYTVGSSYNTGDYLRYNIRTVGIKTDGTFSVYLTDRNNANWASGKYYHLNSAEGWQPSAVQPFMEGSTQMASSFTPGTYYVLGTWQGVDGVSASDFSDQPIRLVSATQQPAPTCSISGIAGAEMVSGTSGVNLSWVTANASSATLTGGAMNLNTAVPVTGNQFGQPTQMWVSQSGTYTLTVQGAGGSGSCSITIASTQPAPTFTAAPTSGQAPLTVTFSTNSASDIKFGDGQTGQITPPSTSHTYASAGTYTASANGISVTITVSGSSCGERGCSITPDPLTYPTNTMGGSGASSDTNINLANALSALESALKALLGRLGQ